MKTRIVNVPQLEEVYGALSKEEFQAAVKAFEDAAPDLIGIGALMLGRLHELTGQRLVAGRGGLGVLVVAAARKIERLRKIQPGSTESALRLATEIDTAMREAALDAFEKMHPGALEDFIARGGKVEL